MPALGDKIHFLSHMQRGLGQYLNADGRISAEVTLESANRSDVATAQFSLLGPEHVSAVGSDQVLRRLPEEGAQDMAPNLFPCIEFGVADLPWMFSPSSARSKGRIKPWIVLVVVEQQTGVALRLPTGDGKISVLQIRRPVDIKRELPDLSESWAWAHVQCSADLEKISPEGAFSSAPEAFLSRLMCPRKLKPMTEYIACVVPAFAGGVRKGLGLSGGAEPHKPAWTGGENQLDLPSYSAWRFRTAQRGDFESLVSKLAPVELTAGAVGMDLSLPGDPRLPEKRGSTATFQGALVGTESKNKPMDPRLRKRWVDGMVQILATHRKGKSAKTTGSYDALKDDPVVAPPLWGARKIGAVTAPDPPHEGKAPKEPAWFSTLNHHPEDRAAAGLGAEAVRLNQEELMAEAWRQAEGLREVNQVLNQSRLAAETTQALRRSKIVPLSEGVATQLATVARSRMGQLEHNWKGTKAPDGLVSPAFGRQLRKTGPIGRRVAKTSNLEVSLPAGTIEWFGQKPEVATKYLDFYQPAKLGDADAFSQARPPTQNSNQSNQLRLDIRKRFSVQSFTPNQTLGLRRVVLAQEVIRKTVSIPRLAKAESVTLQKQAMTVTTARTLAAFDPLPVLSARVRARVNAPARLLGKAPIPAPMLVTPVFDLPGYELLRAISADAVMPGVSEVPMNSVGLARVNAAFVEAWLVGANAEMAREFLWREYPGRLNGTYFRQFWDVPDGDPDIAPIAGWAKGTLGSHQIGAGTDGTLILLIKGEVLRRYPSLRIYASRAKWDDRGFRLEPHRGEKEAKRSYPLFGGWLNRTTAFYAFDLRVDEAKGSLARDQAAGWFFVFEQPDTGIQFGLDVPEADAPSKPNYWEQLSWAHALDEPLGNGPVTHVGVERGVGRSRIPYALDGFRETWGRSSSAQARITLQRPVRVLVHASAMLR